MPSPKNLSDEEAVALLQYYVSELRELGGSSVDAVNAGVQAPVIAALDRLDEIAGQMRTIANQLTA